MSVRLNWTMSPASSTSRSATRKTERQAHHIHRRDWKNACVPRRRGPRSSRRSARRCHFTRRPGMLKHFKTDRCLFSGVGPHHRESDGHSRSVDSPEHSRELRPEPGCARFQQPLGVVAASFRQREERAHHVSVPVRRRHCRSRPCHPTAPRATAHPRSPSAIGGQD